MKTQHFYDEDTFTLTYLVFDENTKDAVLIDPVLNYDPKASKISYEQIETIKKSFLYIDRGLFLGTFISVNLNSFP